MRAHPRVIGIRGDAPPDSRNRSRASSRANLPSRRSASGRKRRTRGDAVEMPHGRTE